MRYVLALDQGNHQQPRRPLRRRRRSSRGARAANHANLSPSRLGGARSRENTEQSSSRCSRWLKRRGAADHIAAIGITNQRETHAGLGEGHRPAGITPSCGSAAQRAAV